MVKKKIKMVLPKKNSNLKNLFASIRSRIAQDQTPITLPKIKALTLDEIEKKYGKL